MKKKTLMLEELTKKYKETTKKMILEMEREYDEAWQRMIQDIEKKRIEVTEDLEQLEKKKMGLDAEVNELSQKVIDLSEGVKKEKESLNNLVHKSQEKIDQLLDTEKKIEGIITRENACDIKEKELKEKLLEIKAKDITLADRERRVKRYFDALNEPTI